MVNILIYRPDKVHSEVVSSLELHKEAHGPQVVRLVVLLGPCPHQGVLGTRRKQLVLNVYDY